MFVNPLDVQYASHSLITENNAVTVVYRTELGRIPFRCCKRRVKLQQYFLVKQWLNPLRAYSCVHSHFDETILDRVPARQFSRKGISLNKINRNEAPITPRRILNAKFNDRSLNPYQNFYTYAIQNFINIIITKLGYDRYRI